MAFIASRAHLSRSLFSGIIFLVLISRTSGLDISYCSSENTGSSFSAVYNFFQSNGACQQTCLGSYAFAILSGSNCWCSNYAPADTTNTYSCNSKCPGFGSDWCGNPDAGLFAYFLLADATPLGTIGASSSSSPSTASSLSSLVSTTQSRPGSSTTVLSTSLGRSSLIVSASSQSTQTPSSSVAPTATVTEISSASISSSTPVTSTLVSSSAVPSSTSTSSRSTAETTTTPTEVYTSVTTVTGQVRTIIVTPTPTDSTLGSSSSGASASGGGVSPGKVVGIVVGVALGLGLLIGLGVWFWLRRRHRGNDEVASVAGNSARGSNNNNNGVPSRQVSQMSSAGLLNRVPRLTTTGLSSGSGPRSAEGSNLNRQSLGTDQRLNPYAIYAHEESRLSNVSLQDNQDYSRQLRVANPDL